MLGRTARRCVAAAAAAAVAASLGLAATASAGTGVTLAPSAMTLAADPPTFVTGTTTSIGGWLTSGGVGISGVSLTVSRAATGSSPAPLPPVATRNDGTFVFTDAPAAGSYTYTVRWAGDSTRAGVSASASVTASAPGTKLVLGVQRSPNLGSVDGYVLLSYADGSSPAGRTVTLTRAANGSAFALPSLRPDQSGGAKFTDTPPAGTVTYTAAVASDGTHPAATATATTTVLATTTLTARSPAGAWVGDPVVVSGTLSTGSGPVGSGTVNVFRSGCTSATLSATTGTDGAWSVTDTPPVGTCVYQASYAGGSGYNASTASTQTVVSKRTTELTLTVTRGTGSTKKLYTVTAHLGPTHGNRAVTITATTGGTTVTLASGEVDTGGNLKATYQPKTTTTYRATFAGDDWYAERSVQVTV